MDGPSAGSKRPRENALPAEYRDQWIALPRGGTPAGNGPFIPCKPPMSAAASDSLDEGDRFDATMFMDKQVNARRNVGLVVSLIDPGRGIPTPGEQEWEDWDAEFKAIVPVSAEQAAVEFQKIVRAFSASKANATRMVAVFCEDGTNLTGYVVVSYMHQVLNMPLSAALASFGAARHPGLFHAPYIQDLFKRFGKGEPAPAAPSAPQWALNPSTLVPATSAAATGFAVPVARQGPLPVLSATAPAASAPKAAGGGGEGGSGDEKLPAGWTKHFSKTHNRPYYFHKATGKQKWDPPKAESGGGAGAKGSSLKMGALHILYKHQKSRKCSSWRDKEGVQIKARTVDEAKKMMERLRDEIHNEARQASKPLREVFSQRAKKESDCSSGPQSAGDLGLFDKGKMQPAFEKATLATQIGDVSGVIESDSGVHIIFRHA